MYRKSTIQVQRQRTLTALRCLSEAISLYPAERVDAPQVEIQVVHIAEIQDQVPDAMSMVDSEDISALPVNRVNT